MNNYDLADRDWVSRQAAIEIVDFECDGELIGTAKIITKRLSGLPSAQPDITLESAVDYLHSIGWIQEHDRILTESAQTEHNSDDERKIADLHKMVNYLLSRLESQWIPVSEGLPKEYGEYICTMENGQVQECGFVPENQRGLVDGWSTCEADGHKFLGYADVLAWMPLPEPYRKEGENNA